MSRLINHHDNSRTRARASTHTHSHALNSPVPTKDASVLVICARKEGLATHRAS